MPHKPWNRASQVRHLVSLAALASIGLLVTACVPDTGSSASDPSGQRPAAADQPAERRVTGLDLVTQPELVTRQQRTTALAEVLLIQRCMDAADLTYPIDERIVEPVPNRPAAPLRERQRDGYGLFDEAADESDGTPDPYAPDGSGDGGSASVSDQHLNGLTSAEREQYRRTLLGSEADRRAIRLPDDGEVSFPGGGCIGHSREQLYGDLLTGARLTYVPQRLNQRLSAELERSESYRAAIRRWSVCMAEQGHDAQNPEQVVRTLRERYREQGANPDLRAEEIELAVHDWTCARQQRIPALSRDLMARLFDELPRAERSALAELAAAWTEAVDRSEQVIDDRCARTDPSLPRAVCRDR